MKTWQKLRKNPELWDRYFIREKVIKAVRQYLDTAGFHEVEAPTLISHPPAESHLDLFQTTLLDRQRRETTMYLSTSPEVPIKKLMVAGLGNCYTITKSFRNAETQGNLHNPEFTILELYRAGATYLDLIPDVEALMGSVVRSLGREFRALTYQGNTIDLTPPWERLSVARAFETHARVNFDEFSDEANARRIARDKGYAVEQNTTWEQLYNQIFLNEIEPFLGMGRPTILYDFPSVMAALSKKKPNDPRFAQRFEWYIAGLELGDCYSELTDWQEQEARFEKELKELQRFGKTTYDYDHDFIDALKAGLPECSGIAIGVDRLVMLLADVADIADTLFFPVKEMAESAD